MKVVAIPHYQMVSAIQISPGIYPRLNYINCMYIIWFTILLLHKEIVHVCVLHIGLTNYSAGPSQYRTRINEVNELFTLMLNAHMYGDMCN